MLITTLLLVTLAQDDSSQQQYRNEAQQQAARDNFAAQNKLRSLQDKTQMDLVKTQTAQKANTTSKAKPQPACLTATVGELNPLGGSFNESTNVLTVFLEEDDGSLWTAKFSFETPDRRFPRHSRLAVESPSGLQFVSVMSKFVQTQASPESAPERHFKAMFFDVTLHTAANVFEPSESAEGCLVIPRLAFEVPWYD